MVNVTELLVLAQTVDTRRSSPQLPSAWERGYLFIYLCICVAIYLSIYLSIYLCICVAIYLSIYLCICVAIYLSIYLSVYLCIYLSIYRILGYFRVE